MPCWSNIGFEVIGHLAMPYCFPFMSPQGSEVWKDVARFQKYAHASLELCKIYMVISSSTESLRELHAAEMHLRNTVKQARF